MSRTQTFVDQVMSKASPKGDVRVGEAGAPAERVDRPQGKEVDEVRMGSRRTDMPPDALTWWPC
jgi:hypothetical protein